MNAVVKAAFQMLGALVALALLCMTLWFQFHDDYAHATFDLLLFMSLSRGLARSVTK